MRIRLTFLFCLALQLPSWAAAQSRANLEAPATVKLPLKRIVLYKNGIGYFEHLGRVLASQEVTIDFTTGQLNDVLKSLTVLDLGNGRITGVSYNTEAPLGRRLGALRLPLGEQTTMNQFLDGLRGARLEVRTAAGIIHGRLLSVERKTRAKADKLVESEEVMLMTEAGEARAVELSPRVSVRIVERDLNDQVQRYLRLVASTRDQDLRRMVVSTSGSGERPLFVSYISEVPVWKTTYRIVLPSKPNMKPMLQGWAIVDNTVGEDWNHVELSLVAGAPQSFVQQLSQPYFTRRPLVPLPQGVLLTPQTHQATLAPTAPQAAPGVPGGQVSGTIGGMPGGVGAGTGGGVGGTFRQRFAEAGAQTELVAQARELGDLFEYKLKEPVTIRKNQSALVPIIQAEITAEKVSLWNESLGHPQPWRTLWVTNTSGLTLDGGSFNVLEDETFAGEGLVEALKPGERRLLSFAVDLGVRVEANQESEHQRATRVRIIRGVLIQQSEERERKTYTIRNENTTERTIVIEHRRRPEWKLAGDISPEETSADFHRFRVTVEPKKTATLVVLEARPSEIHYQLTDLNNDLIGLLVRQGTINREVEQALRPIVAMKNQIAVLEAQIQPRQKQLEAIFQDQERLRENLKALKGSAEEKALVQRYTKQLNEQESRLETLRREIAELQEKLQQVRTELGKTVQDLVLDANL